MLDDIFEEPEIRAKWIRRFRVAYVLWMIFLILGIAFLALYNLLK